MDVLEDDAGVDDGVELSEVEEGLCSRDGMH